ncbi:unnamed protein product [Phaedon cochleariae]|uniref:AB hydrolase-1 domain-containing protein n=1 Tax=Phaedon cochleariae TaxID=80249 RepID=A0A9P0GIL5_PHACE|nr:unnamed protein product [Phaedon cochleariae]
MMVLWKNAISRLLRLNRYYNPVAKCSSMVQEQKIVIGGQTINYVKVGHGSKTIFCLSGVMGSIWRDFKPQIDGFDRNKFTVVVWDPPGYGRSRPPLKKFTPKFYENDAECAHQFMKELGISKYSLVGWSDGGVTSIIHAANYPEKVEKLIVWGSGTFIIPEEIESIELMRDLKRWSHKMKEPLLQFYTEEELQLMLNEWRDTLAEILQNGGNICKDRLGDLKCPTLILHGDKDPALDPIHPGFMIENIKNAKLHRFPEGKHTIHLKYSEEFNKLVTDFILEKE